MFNELSKSKGFIVGSPQVSLRQDAFLISLDSPTYSPGQKNNRRLTTKDKKLKPKGVEESKSKPVQRQLLYSNDSVQMNFIETEVNEVAKPSVTD
jgi:hypothetical protein